MSEHLEKIDGAFAQLAAAIRWEETAAEAVEAGSSMARLFGGKEFLQIEATNALLMRERDAIADFIRQFNTTRLYNKSNIAAASIQDVRTLCKYYYDDCRFGAAPKIGHHLNELRREMNLANCKARAESEAK